MLARTALCCAFAGALSACAAHDVRTRLASAPYTETGSISILLTQPARDLTVAIDGMLVADRVHSRTVRVDGVPAGMVDVVIAAGGGEARVERHVRVEVKPGQVTAIPIGAPEQGLGSAMNLGMLSVAAFVLSRAIAWVFL